MFACPSKRCNKQKHCNRRKVKETTAFNQLYHKSMSIISIRNHLKMRWSEATTLEFVKQYIKHECLWNPAHPSYKLKYKREEAYSQIISDFKPASGKYLSVPEVKCKIKNLRTTYSQQVQKILKKSGPNAMYEPSLVWFHEMDNCLKNIPSARHNNSNQELPEVGSTSPSSWAEHRELLTNAYEDTDTDPLVPTNLTEEDESISSSPQKYTTESHKKNKRKKLKRKQPVQTYVIDSRSENSAKEDEFDIYGKYIASQLRKMDLHKALQIQLEIQSLVSGARLSNDE